MRALNGGQLFEIREAPTFGESWSRAIVAGHINPMTESPTLLHIKGLLARNPHLGGQDVNSPANYRRIRLIPNVNIWYSIVEDDRVIYLEVVSIPDPGRQSPP